MSSVSRPLDPAGVRRLYDRIAPLYDLLAAPYKLVGGRKLAQAAIDELRLRPGDTVVDLGTGSGWNLPHLAERVAPTGNVIGVDISPRMLERADARTSARQDVALVEADIARYRPPVGTNAVISTFAIEMLPEYPSVIERYVAALEADGRLVTTGLREPERWPEWAITLGSRVNRVFGVSEAYRHHRPWEPLLAATREGIYREAFAGAIYLAAGTRPAA